MHDVENPRPNKSEVWRDIKNAITFALVTIDLILFASAIALNAERIAEFLSK